MKNNASLPLSSRPSRGFALVVTLSLMILLTVLAVGLLTLSSVALRGTSKADAMAMARANARVALQLAIGELQLQTGSDTRVTARADILDENNPPVLGAWKSWEGEDHEKTGSYAGRPVSPGSSYRSAKQSRFLAWLTSANYDDPSQLPDTAPANGKVALVGPGSVTSPTGKNGKTTTTNEIHLTPTQVANSNRQGSIAWWVGGENQKARLPKPYQPSDVTSPARWSVQAKTHSTADPDVFRMEKLLDDATPADKAITLQQADLVSDSTKSTVSKVSREFFYDLSTVSTGLLTNTATGGWRKDMSLLSENWSTVPTSGLPFFRVTPDSDTSGTFATTSDTSRAYSMFYPWSAYTQSYGGWPQAVASWNNLMDYVTFYKRQNTATDNNITTTSAGVRQATAWADVGTDPYRGLHKVRLYPVLARVQWVFSHFAEPVANSNPATYTPWLIMTPVITMWNPYNLKLIVNSPFMFEFKMIPLALSYQIGGNANSSYNCVIWENDWAQPLTNRPCLLPDYQGSGARYFTCRIEANDLALNPGETRLYSPSTSYTSREIFYGNPVGNAIPLTPGLHAGTVGYTGYKLPVKVGSTVVPPQPAGTEIRANAKFDTEYSNSVWAGFVVRPQGVGSYLEVTEIGGNVTQQHCSAYSIDMASKLYPPVVGVNMAAGAIEGFTIAKPFLSCTFGPRIATTFDGNGPITNYSTKGLTQCSPFAHWRPAFPKDNVHAYAGSGNPVNFRFDYSFVTHSGSTYDTNIPGAGPNDNSGFIINGVESTRGIKRCIMAELPSRPLCSLAELVNWDVTVENPCPPHMFNVIGNSDASPLISPNTVCNPNDANLGSNMRHDHSYCANHLLFDDWFLSGIAPDPTNFGISGRDIQTTYKEFVTGKTPLATRAYQPLRQDRAAATASSAAATQLYDDNVKITALKSTAWRTIASRLEVEGMFNVNSTSVTAWRALLGHARNQRVPYMRQTGELALSNESDFAVSRFSVAGDVQAGTSTANDQLAEATDFTGYRVLDEKFIDTLAEQIVIQIRKRGPFLSLAEFINRQLSNDKDLAIAGALQAALNELTKSGSSGNPLKPIQTVARTSDANVPEGTAAEDKIGYVFPEAAVGYSSYGVPGWTRQADILRPLAPILSARDDTFTIRAYGDARDAQGKILARSVCEATVRRTREFVDTADKAEILTAPTKSLNKTFGRRFELVSFRWLGANEI